MSSIQSLGARALVVLLLGGAGVMPARGADPFYERLLERGVQNLELGLVDEALQKLRIASFGFLDEPDLLAQALAQLGRAQERSGDSAELTDTVMRLVEIEDRFGAYSKIDEDLRASFESSLRTTLPREMLARLEVFRHLTVEPDTVESTTASVTPKQRLKALEQELAADENSVSALLELARIHYGRGKAKPAVRYLDRLLTVEPSNQEGRCLRSRLAIDRKECAPALAGLEQCAQLTTTGVEDAFVLDCLVSAGRDDEARAYFDQVPPDRREAHKMVRAARKPGEPAEDAPTEAPDGSELPLMEGPEDGTNEPATEAGPPENEFDPALEERLTSLRADIGQSRFREQLEDSLTTAITLADDYPDSVEAQHLAAEIAYLSAEWQMVADYFDRGGPPSEDRPEFVFYLAVAHYELGNRLEAAAILRPVLSMLARSPFVDAYIDRILAPAPS